MDYQLPELGEGVVEAELVEWFVAPGDAVKKGQRLAEVMTDKATMELPSPFTGKINELRVTEGDTINVGSVILAYEIDGAATKSSPKRKTKKKKGKKSANENGKDSPVVAAVVKTAGESRVPASPSVRRKARQLGLHLSDIEGTGPRGRILIDDLMAVGPVDAKTPRKETTSANLDYQPGQRIKLKGLRRRIAEHMVQAKRIIPHYSYVDECDVTELVQLRKSLKDAAEQAGAKLTYLAFFVKAVVTGLKEFPIVNSSLDDDASEIVLHDRYHIGIATNVPDGLMVPVIHDADKKDVLQIARDIEQLTSAARAGNSSLDDLRGATFTITSIGSIGGLISSPIINHPEVGIMGVGKIVKRPVYDDEGEIHPADMLYLSFSFDHRIVDGAVGASFGNAVIRLLQNPAEMLLPNS